MTTYTPGAPQELFAHDLTLCNCGHEKARHDPEDGNCEAGSYPPCKCPAFDITRPQGSDACFCGDYRSQHRTGACRLAHGTLGKCDNFHFSARANEAARKHWGEYHGEYRPEKGAASPGLLEALKELTRAFPPREFWVTGDASLDRKRRAEKAHAAALEAIAQAQEGK